MLRLPVAHQRLLDNLRAGLDMRVPQFRQFYRIALSRQNGVDDRQTRHSRHVTNSLLDLQVHLRQRFLHMLHMVPGTPLPSIPLSCGQFLLVYDWPGNIRELENLMRKLIVLRNPDWIAEDLRRKAARRTLCQALPAQSQHGRVAEPTLEQLTKAKVHAESEAILTALNATRWNRKQAAAQLNIEYKALLYKMKKLRIDKEVTTFRAKVAASGA